MTPPQRREPAFEGTLSELRLRGLRIVPVGSIADTGIQAESDGRMFAGALCFHAQQYVW